MYYARGGDSLNFSCLGDGNAVLIKSATPYLDTDTSPEMIRIMQNNNPHPNSPQPRPLDKLCNGQTLLCKSLGLKVPVWNQQGLQKESFALIDYGYRPKKIIQTTRLGIPQSRDEHLPYRFIDHQYAKHCTQNPLRRRKKLVIV